MGDSDENTPPIHVLLPTCDETNTDVFLEILKSVVLHTRLHDNIHINSVISGMTGETFQVDTDDLSVDWKNLTSNSRQMRQSKLIGFWAARHYPLIGKKLIGATWQPPNKYNVQVCEPMENTEEEIDNIVSKKMKLRIIELYVCKGTSKKLNYFVRAPMVVGRINATILSSKMRAFDIPDEYLAECWNALKAGRFLSNFEQQIDSTAALKAPKPSIVTSDLTNDQPQLVRRNGDQSEGRNYRSIQSSNVLSSTVQHSVISPCNVLLADISAITSKKNLAIEPTTMPNAKRARVATSTATGIMHDETNIDVLRVAVCEMRKDIDNLTKCIGRSASESELERFHLAVFKQKDDEISKLTEFLQKLEKENELLKNDQTKLNGEIEAKSNLIGALNKLLEVNSKLHGKMEEDSNVTVQKLAEANKLNIVLTETNDKLQDELTTIRSRLAHFDTDFQKEKHELLQKLSAANQLNCELTDTIGTLRQELQVTKNHSSNTESNFQDLVQKLSAADDEKVELTKTNGELQEALSAANNHVGDMELNLQCQIQDLIYKLSAAEQANMELTDKNNKIQQDFNAMTNHAANTESNLQYQLQDLVHKLSAADQVKIELTDTNGKLQQELNAMTNQAVDTESNLQYQLQDLVRKLSAADQVKIELTDTNGKLQQELNAAQIELKKNETLTENLHKIKARTNILLDEFRARAEGIEKVNADLVGKNEKLQAELNILKQDACEDKVLLLLPSRSEEYIQAERKEVSIHANIDQAEFEKQNIQCVSSDNYKEKLLEPIDPVSTEGRSSESFDDLQTGGNSNELAIETVKSGECLTVEPKNGVRNEDKIFFWEEDFVSDDEIVKECRPILQQQKFGWVKFHPYKSSKFFPAFVYAVDEDGMQRAQKIKSDGYITDTKSPFWEFHFAWELPDEKKQSPQVFGLKKFNKRFGVNLE